jgi:hypothetical protein
VEWLKMLSGVKSWEIAVSIVGGYLAAKNLEQLSRLQFLTYIIIAVVFGFAAVDFAIPYATDIGYLSERSASNLKPLAILMLSAGSLKFIDIFYGWIQRLRDFKLGK